MLIKRNHNLRLGVITGIFVMLMAVIGISCTPNNDINRRIDTIVKHDAFSIAGWEVKTLSGEVKSSGITTITADDIDTVKQYFALTDQLNTIEAKRTANEAINGINELSLQESQTKRTCKHKETL